MLAKIVAPAVVGPNTVARREVDRPFLKSSINATKIMMPALQKCGHADFRHHTHFYHTAK
jgi:hypothetical protein